MALQRIICFARGDHEIGDLLRKEPPQPIDAFDFRNLRRNFLLEGLVPRREAFGQFLDLVMQNLLTQHRTYAGEEGRMLERLGQVIITSRIEPLDDITCV